MCYHYSLTKIALRSENRFSAFQSDYKIIEEYDDMYHVNGFKFPEMPVVASDAPDRFQMMNWGLVPSWVKSKEDAIKFRAQTLNARSDTMYEKPSYRSASKYGRRCLIPAEGIFEWQAVNKKKYPYFIHMKDNSPFFMGGIWEEWTERNTGELMKTFSLVTTDANPLMAKIHNDGQRMPVIIPEELTLDWLNQNLTKEDVLALSTPYNEEMMAAHTISRLITSRTEETNVPDIKMEVSYPELAVQQGFGF